LVFTALRGLGRAWAPESEAGALDGLVLATADRSAIWLGKALATLAFLMAAELVALPAFALFFAPLDGPALLGVLLASVGICAVGSLVSAMAAAARGREVLLPLLFLPLAIPLVVGGVGSSISPEPGAYLAFLGLYDAVFAILSWRRSSTSSPNEHHETLSVSPRGVRGRARRGVGPDDVLRGSRGRRPGPVAEDLLRPRADRAH